MESSEYYDMNVGKGATGGLEEKMTETSIGGKDVRRKGTHHSKSVGSLKKRFE
jgi:hypothetical protein